jgi:hypothetical protein
MRKFFFFLLLVSFYFVSFKVVSICEAQSPSDLMLRHHVASLRFDAGTRGYSQFTHPEGSESEHWK